MKTNAAGWKDRTIANAIFTAEVEADRLASQILRAVAQGETDAANRLGAELARKVTAMTQTVERYAQTFKRFALN